MKGAGPSRFVREAMARRVAEGLCPICGAKPKKPILVRIGVKQGDATCPNINDRRHAQPVMTLKRFRRMQKGARKK